MNRYNSKPCRTGQPRQKGTCTTDAPPAKVNVKQVNEAIAAFWKRRKEKDVVKFN